MRFSQETKIAHVRLRVKDLKKSVTFYSDLLGFRAVMREDSAVALSATGQLPFQILLSESPAAQPRPPRTTGQFHIAIRSPNREELAKTLLRLAEHGYRIHGAADHAVSEAIYLADPDGKGIELYCDRPKEEWKRVNGELYMTTDYLDVEALLKEAEAKSWAGIHPPTDIGHIHLNVGSLETAEAFYHHHTGVNIWAGRNATRPPEDAAGLETWTRTHF